METRAALAALSVLTAAASAQLPPDFETAIVIVDAIGGEFRGHGDFDGDGDIDLIHFTGPTTNWTGFRLFLNDGTGGLTPTAFVPFGFPGNYSLGTLQPRTGDFDGDGNLDFVIARNGPAMTVGEGVEFFLGDGAGGISARHYFPLTNPTWLHEGSMNGDAALDVAVHFTDPTLGNHLAWLRFSNGQPVLGPWLPLTGGVPNAPLFETVDVDGDGFDDIVAAVAATTAFDKIVFFPTVAGAPTLGAQYVIPAQMQNVNLRPRVGDLDGDGDREFLVVKRSGSDTGTWVQAFERTTSGWLQHSPELVATPTTGWLQPHNTWLLDWDGDGWLDVAASSSRIDTVRSDGDWTFSEGFETLGTGQREGGGAADLDGDGHPEFIAGYSILRGDGSFAPKATLAPLPILTNLVFDREGDGDLDLTRWSDGAHSANNATGAFQATTSSFPPAPPTNVYAVPIAYADFDGDGHGEFLVLFGQQIWAWPFPFIQGVGMHRIPDDGNGGYRPGVLATTVGVLIDAPPGNSVDAQWATGDADGDGDIDLLVEGGYHQNDGNGNLDLFVAAYAGRGRAVADLDGNGFPDLVVTAYSPASNASDLRVYYGSASGFNPQLLATHPGRLDASLRDLDGDGDLDLLAAADSQLGLFLFENVGTGFFAGTTAMPDVDAAALQHVGVVDFDGDGVPDLLVRRQLSNPTGIVTDTLARFRNAGSGLTYDLVAEHACPYGVTGFADFDGDGDLDAFGSALLRSHLVPAGAGGALRQYGNGVAGSGGIAPMLGANGPVVSSSANDKLRLVRGIGGGSTLLVFGLVEAAMPNAPLPGLTLHVGDPVLVLPPPLTGTPGSAGTGTLTLTLPNLAGIAGFTVVHQAFVLDPGAAAGWTATNGLAITYGL
tara:strand:- start:9382 stop:12036 length:2655 start_codon:yes stop_codon:yes gene_type:complete